ncbi:MOSC domain-containing protein [Prauserella oleivorans]|uniref:MOSC domain-containing protein n=1 Tax=Prauserella oleivorans TaxID=1478153 RepID=A0ABW5WCE6_9PSEU
MAGRIRGLYVYPVKGLSPQPLPEVTLEAGRGVPHDRAFALARPEGRYVPGLAEPLPKTQFFMLARDESLAAFTTHVDTATNMLRVEEDGREVLVADLGTPGGADEVTAFFARALGRTAEDAPVLAHADGRRFTDVSVVSDAMMNAVSLLNLESIRALEERIGEPVDPLRFRANVYFDGMPPFSERELVGEEITIGGLRLRGVLATKRCAATEVNPATGRRDLPLPRLLKREFGHIEMGVYAEVLTGGTVRPGDPIAYPAPG